MQCKSNIYGTSVAIGTQNPQVDYKFCFRFAAVQYNSRSSNEEGVDFRV